MKILKFSDAISLGVFVLLLPVPVVIVAPLVVGKMVLLLHHTKMVMSSG